MLSAEGQNGYKANMKTPKIRIKARRLLYPQIKTLTNTHSGFPLFSPSSFLLYCIRHPCPHGQCLHGKFTHIIGLVASPFSSSSFQTISGRMLIPLLSTLSSLLSSILGPKRVLIMADNHRAVPAIYTCIGRQGACAF